jgi:hypothetical protein
MPKKNEASVLLNRGHLLESHWAVLDAVSRAGGDINGTYKNPYAKQLNPALTMRLETIRQRTWELGYAGYLNIEATKGRDNTPSGKRRDTLRRVEITQAGKDLLGRMPRELRDHLHKNLAIEPEARAWVNHGVRWKPEDRKPGIWRADEPTVMDEIVPVEPTPGFKPEVDYGKLAEALLVRVNDALAEHDDLLRQVEYLNRENQMMHDELMGRAEEHILRLDAIDAALEQEAK